MKALIIAVIAMAMAACSTPPSRTDAPQPKAGLANPAAVACIKQGGQVDLRKDASGNVTGICKLPDQRECEEWALFRDGQCVLPADLKR